MSGGQVRDTLASVFELEIVGGNRAGEVIEVRDTVLVGRGEGCTLVLDDLRASREHASFHWDGVNLEVVDNGSSNGTLVNGVKIRRGALSDGDVVCIGQTYLRVREKPPEPAPESDWWNVKPAKAAKPLAPGALTLVDSDVMAGHTMSLSVLMAPPQHADAAVSARRLEAVLAVARALADIRNQEKLFATVLDSLFVVFPQADRGFLLLGKTVDALESKAHRQRGGGTAAGLEISTSICSQALETRSALLYNQMEDAKFAVGESVLALGIRSALAIPLMVESDVEGLLLIDSGGERPFGADDLALAVAVSQQVAIALHNALLLETVERETTIRNNLARFLPGPLVDQAMAGEINLSLGGSRCCGTILFSDVVGFTRLSESLEPEQVVSLMNRYFERMVPCIHRSGGAIDKYIGDAIMAFWGIPFATEQSVPAAGRAALEMQIALEGLNSEHAARGAPFLAMGLGINTGSVVAGNIGAEERVEYTVLGDVVNTAQRLESAAGATEVLLSAATRAALGGAFFGLRMPPLKVKNKATLLDTYSLRGLALQGGNVLLYLPVRAGSVAAVLVERLFDGTFVLLGPPSFPPGPLGIVTAIPEWPNAKLGQIEVLGEAPRRREDGALARFRARLSDPTLRGLLGTEPLPCLLEWPQMPRSSAG